MVRAYVLNESIYSNGVFMKNIIFATLTAITFLGFSCAKSGGSTVQQPTATTMNTDCVNNPQLCNNNYYNNNYGFQPYNYNNGGYYNAVGSNLCNCPSGTMPTYNAYAGMGCVNANVVNSGGSGGLYGYAYFGYGTGSGANNNQWMNIPQVSNYVGYNNQSCYNGVVQSCMTDQQNMCSTGFTCIASNASSRMGLCVSNSAAGSGAAFR